MPEEQMYRITKNEPKRLKKQALNNDFCEDEFIIVGDYQDNEM